MNYQLQHVWSRNRHALVWYQLWIGRWYWNLCRLTVTHQQDGYASIVTICMSFDLYELWFWISKISLLHYIMSCVFCPVETQVTLWYLHAQENFFSNSFSSILSSKQFLSPTRLICCMEDRAREAKSRKQNNDTASQRLIHHKGRLINLQLGLIKLLLHSSWRLRGAHVHGYEHLQKPWNGE